MHAFNSCWWARSTDPFPSQLLGHMRSLHPHHRVSEFSTRQPWVGRQSANTRTIFSVQAADVTLDKLAQIGNKIQPVSPVTLSPVGMHTVTSDSKANTSQERAAVAQVLVQKHVFHEAKQ